MTMKTSYKTAIDSLSDVLSLEYASKHPSELQGAYGSIYKDFFVRILTALDVLASKQEEEARKEWQTTLLHMSCSIESAPQGESSPVGREPQQQETSCNAGNAGEVGSED